jgi:serine/threonine protein kinase
VISLIDVGKAVLQEAENPNKGPEVNYIALELATGGMLFDFIYHTGVITEKEARYFFHQLIEGLNHIHFQGQAHRDLKLENALLDKNRVLKIADFGLAAPIYGRDGSGVLRTKVGTHQYMAPEVYAEVEYYGSKADLFSCGCMLFIMVAGVFPFNTATE